MRRYGGDTMYAKEGLRRELARRAFTAALSPEVNVTRDQRTVELTPGQKAALDAVDRQVAAARIARMQGKANAAALGVIHESATNQVINAHAQSGKLDEVASIAAEKKGKPGVIFARSLAAVERIKKRLESEGHRVILITGKNSSKDKVEKIRAFKPDAGSAKPIS